MKRKLLFIVPLLLAVRLIAAASSPSRFVITDHGAVGDGTAMNTKAIQETIDQCAARGGGVVVVPKGIFFSGAIFFKQGVNLLIEKDGILKGSTNSADYPQVATRWEGVEREWSSAFVNFFNMTNVTLSGEGMIDGSGTQFSRGFRRPLSTNAPAAAISPATNNVPRTGGGRPRLIALQNCTDVRVSSLHFKDQASWCLFMVYCENVVAENLVIRADHSIPSSDGIDIDSSSHVLVTGCDIDCNDDCISIKAGKDEDGLRVNRPSEHILIEKTRFGFGHGGVAMGSEVSGGIRHVLVQDCIAEGNAEMVRFKSQPSRGGVVEDIVFRNIEMKDSRAAVYFNLAWRMVPPIAPPAKVLTQIRNVRLINLHGTVNSIGSISGLPGSFISDVKFENCNLTAQRGLTLDNTRDIDTTGLKIEGVTGEAITQISAP